MTDFRMNDHSEALLLKVHPALAAKVRQMADILKGEGIPIIVSAGLRTVEQQHNLWLIGRNEQGQVINKKDIVTKANGGQSWHNFGCAVDCDPDDPTKAGFQIDWNADHPQWKRMEEVGVSLGLTSGANWKRIVDAPHFQLTGRFPENAPNDEARELYRVGGLEAVWNEIVVPEEIPA